MVLTRPLGPGSRVDTPSRLLKKTHLPGPILRMGTPRARAALRRTGSVRLAPRPVPIRQGWVTPPCIWTFLSSLGRTGFFSNRLGAERPRVGVA